ncbi:uncharacterized protein LOC122529434 [Frieseomelitta varia]|uniref:uncharacterized protein LOC122529434 n=1 Tax=Frieseomelitta varia TaxID=561572 RepID=UPI001CB69903|nr:uncharacterized protein LOC122529434 [Frieseomelitta varia]
MVPNNHEAPDFNYQYVMMANSKRENDVASKREKISSFIPTKGENFEEELTLRMLKYQRVTLSARICCCSPTDVINKYTHGHRSVRTCAHVYLAPICGTSDKRIGEVKR